MREATFEEFESALAKARWPAPEFCFTERTTDVFYKDRGTDVAHKTIIRKRGKVIQTMYMVNEAYLKK